MKTHRIESVPIAKLAPADYNPREIDDASMAGLKASVERFGLVEPIVWNEGTGRVVGGHQRLKVLLSMGAKDVEAVVVDLPEGEERALNIALNNPHIGGEFTDDLQGLLLGIMEDDTELFTDLRLDELLAADTARAIDNDDPPEVPEVPVSKLGDVIELGEHLLLCGDSTDAAQVVRIMDDPPVCMWTDPPYGVDYVGKTKAAKTIENDGAKGLPALLADAFDVADQFLAPGSFVYIAHPAGANSLVFYDAVAGAGWVYRQGLVWLKDSMVLGHSDYHYSHEPIIYALKPGEGRRGRGGAGWYGDNAQTTVFEFPRPKRSESHPTMKPIELVEAMLANSTKPGDVVYEPFGGSGSTLIACEKLMRRCRCVELDPGYCDVIVSRWEAATGGTVKRRK